MRTNAGYDRRWEARKLWGGLVGRCRNASIGAMSHGPSNSERHEKARSSVGGSRLTRVWRATACGVKRPSAEVVTLLGQDDVVQRCDRLGPRKKLGACIWIPGSSRSLGPDGAKRIRVARPGMTGANQLHAAGWNIAGARCTQVRPLSSKRPEHRTQYEDGDE
jgi:hypothetical protein